MTPTEICNMSLDRVGAARITSFDNSNTAEGIACRLHFWHTVNYLLESFDWPFSRGRAILSQSTDDPAFEWDNQFLLPSDFLAMRHNYTESKSSFPDERWEIEGNMLMTNDSEVSLKYTKKVTDTSQFSTLFIELLVLTMAFKMLPKIAGTEAASLTKTIGEELTYKTNKARSKTLQDGNTSGRSDWNYAHYGSFNQR